MEIPGSITASWETCMQDKKQQLEQNLAQWTGSKLGKEYVKAVYCHSADGDCSHEIKGRLFIAKLWQS